MLWGISMALAAVGFEASGHFSGWTYAWVLVLIGLAQAWPQVASNRSRPSDDDGLEGKRGPT